MPDVNLSKAVRSNLLSLQSTAATMAKTQERLATGLKVNSALDNPSNFFTASALNSRAGDMASLLDSMSSGIKTIEAADNGIQSITKTVESMQSALRQARQDKSFKTASLTINAEDINGATGQTRQLTLSGGAFGDSSVSIDLTKATNATSTAQNAYSAPAASTGATLDASATYVAPGAATSFSIQGTGDAAATSITVASGATKDDAIVSINSQLSSSGSSVRVRDNAGKLQFFDGDTAQTGTAATITVTASAGSASLGLTVDASTNNVKTGADAATKQISINGHAITLNGDDDKTAAAAADHINAALKAQGAAAGLKASVDSSNKLVITGPDDGTGVTIAGTDAASVFGTPVTTTAKAAGDAAGKVKTVDELVSEINIAAKDKVRASNDNGKLRIENLSTEDLAIAGATDGGVGNGSTSSTTDVGGNDVRKNLVEQFNFLRDQLDKFADDASFNGINLLRGDKLKLTFNETGTSTIEIQAKDVDGTPTSINSTTLGIDPVTDEDFDSDSTIDTKLDELSDVMGKLRSQASSFGSNLSIVENRTDFTKKMINTLETGASNLTLADTNEEAANLLALQTRQQLSSTALSMASQADQAVLRLF